jgi:hypothetical protein
MKDQSLAVLKTYFDEARKWCLNEWRKEERSDFQLLRRIPNSSLQAYFCYLDSLDASTRDSVRYIPNIRCGPFGVPPTDPQTVQFIRPHLNRILEIENMRPPPHLHNKPTASFSALRKAMGNRFKLLLPEVQKSRLHGTSFVRVSQDRPFALRVWPKGWVHGFEYSIGIPSAKSVFTKRWLTYENLLGFTHSGWDCLFQTDVLAAAETFVAILTRLDDFVQSSGLPAVQSCWASWDREFHLSQRPMVHMSC